jgi:serine/threonine protein kinase
MTKGPHQFYLDRPKLPEPGDEVAGYRIEESLGRGAMGVVYRARRLEDNRLAAIKFLLTEEIIAKPKLLDTLRKRFVREARLLTNLDHPGLPKVYGADHEVERPYYAMEYLDGVPLDKRMDMTPALSIRNTLKLGIGLAETLEYVYNKADAIHRDLKPANIFLVDDATCKLLDFGIAKIMYDEHGGASIYTCAGVQLGTLLYMSPEQHIGGAVDIRSDIYALGVMLFELLAFRAPFEGHGLVALYKAKEAGVKLAVNRYSPKLSPDAAVMIHSMLAFKPEQRPSDYTEIIDVLKQALKKLPQPTAVLTPTNAPVGGMTLPSSAAIRISGPTIQLAAWQDVRELGCGNLGEAYSARKPNDSEQSVVRILRPVFLDDGIITRMRETSTIVANANIKGVVPWQVLSGGELLRTPYIAGPDGTPLDLEPVCRIQEAGFMPERNVGKLAIALLSMLHHLHEAGLVHGNVKPQNVLFHYLSDDGGHSRTRARLTDAALLSAIGMHQFTKHLEECGASAKSTHLRTSDNRAALDTLDYFSPEQRQGDEPTPRSDVYAAGLVILRALTGVDPARDDLVIPNSTNISPAWNPLLSKVLRTDPDRRLDALEMAEYVAFILEG